MQKKNFLFVAKSLMIALLVTSVGTPCCAKAEEEYTVGNAIKSYETSAPNLLDGCEENSVIQKKLEYDVENDTTKLKDNVEVELNEIGIFDEEINDLDDDTIDALNRSINTQISISYIEIDELTGKTKELSADEIDEEIQDQIDSNKIEYEDESIMETLGEKIGFLPVTVKASEPVYEKWDYPTTKNKVKQTVYACQFKKKGTIYVTAKAYWLKEAYYRNIDVFGVTVGRGDIVPNSWSCKHTATYRYTATSPFYSTGTQKMETHPSAVTIGDSGSGLAYKVNLFGDRSKMKACEYAGTIEHYDDEKIEVKFQCKYESKKSVKFVTSYHHSETNKTITPSIGVDSGGISVSVSSSSTQYYSKLSYNAYLLYDHI